MNEFELAILCAIAGARVDSMPTEYTVPGFRGMSPEDRLEFKRRGISPIMGGSGTHGCDTCKKDKPDEDFERADSPTCKDCVTAAVSTTPADLLARLDKTLTTLATQRTQTEEQIATAVAAEVARLTAAGGVGTPSKTVTPGARIEVPSRFRNPDGTKWSRGDFEVAMMVFEGVRNMRGGNPEMMPPEDLRRAYVQHAFEDGSGEIPTFVDPAGRIIRQLDPKRAMDTGESGFGADLIGVQYVREMWQAARNLDSIYGAIREVPISENSQTIPIDGEIPEMKLIAESVNAPADWSGAPVTSKTPTSKRTLTPKKLGIHQIWSGELNEDSIINYTPFLREMLNMSVAMHLGSAYYNGDTTGAATGNVNKNDGTPATSKHYLAWDGIRKLYLVTATGQGLSNAGAAIDVTKINKIRGYLNAADDSVDGGVKTINWAASPRDLLLVTDWDTYLAMLNSDKVTTVDKYGPQATIVSGELGSIYGIPIVAPSYASKTAATGLAVASEASNTFGQVTLFAPRGWVGGVRRDVQLFFDRIQRTDQFLFELYTRRAFQRHSTNVAAGIYNIVNP